MATALNDSSDTLIATGFSSTTAPMSPRSAEIRAKAAQERQNGVRWAEQSGMHPGHVVEFDHLMSLVEQNYVDSSHITGSKKIAQGSFGEISSASLDGTKVAVKQIMLRDADNRAQHMRDVLLEVNVNCKLGHPNVVHFHGVAADFPADGKAKGVFLGLVFEFCDGGSLYQRLHENRSRAKMTIPQKVSTLYQIACGAEHMHSLNIVHRDLSDMNILLCSNGDVKIADLGCARQLNATTYRPSTISGSPPFMAPEQLQGKSITLKVDVWALGVLMWEVFMERKPWENAKATAKNKLGGLEYMQKQMIQQKKDLGAVSWPQMAQAGLNILKATLHSCLDREATTRFTMLDARDCLCELIEHVNGRMPASKLAQLKPLLEADLLDFYKKFNQDKIKSIAQAVSENGVCRAVLNAKLRIKYGVGLESFKSSESAEQDTLVADSVEEGHRHQAEFVKQVEHEQMPADADAVVGGGGGADDALGGGGGGVEYLQREADLELRKEQEIARFAEMNLAQHKALAEEAMALEARGLVEAAPQIEFDMEIDTRDAVQEQKMLSHIGHNRMVEEDRVRAEKRKTLRGQTKNSSTAAVASRNLTAASSKSAASPNRPKPSPKRLDPVIPFRPLPPDAPAYIATPPVPDSSSSHQPSLARGDIPLADTGVASPPSPPPRSVSPEAPPPAHRSSASSPRHNVDSPTGAGEHASRFAKFSPRADAKNSPRSSISPSTAAASVACPMCPHRSPFGATDGVHDVILPEGSVYRGMVRHGRFEGPAEITLDDEVKLTVTSDGARGSTTSPSSSTSNNLQQQVITLLQESRRERMRAASLEQELDKLRTAHTELSNKYVQLLQQHPA